MREIVVIERSTQMFYYPFSNVYTSGRVCTGNRLNYYLSLLEPRQEQVLRKAYLEKVPQEQVARELGVSVRSVQDIKAKAIDALAEMYAFTAGLN